MNKNGNLSRKTFVQSVERALDILELVEKSQRPMRSGEIAKALGLSPATASNLIRTLYMRNYLKHNKDNTYTLGVQNFILGSSADTWKTLRNVSDSILQALSRESEAASFLGVLYQRRMLAINMVIPTSPISIAVIRIGRINATQPHPEKSCSAPWRMRNLTISSVLILCGN